MYVHLFIFEHLRVKEAEVSYIVGIQSNGFVSPDKQKSGLKHPLSHAQPFGLEKGRPSGQSHPRCTCVHLEASQVGYDAVRVSHRALGSDCCVDHIERENTTLLGIVKLVLNSYMR